MKILYNYPPNYDQIKKAFPACERIKGVVFTYGDTLYNPHRILISPDLMAHEETHTKQQTDPVKWWTDYITIPQFRLSQELEAYRAQYTYALGLCSRPQRRRLLNHIVKALSSELYGNLVTYSEARQLILEGRKSE